MIQSQNRLLQPNVPCAKYKLYTKCMVKKQSACLKKKYKLYTECLKNHKLYTKCMLKKTTNYIQSACLKINNIQSAHLQSSVHVRRFMAWTSWPSTSNASLNEAFCAPSWRLNSASSSLASLASSRSNCICRSRWDRFCSCCAKSWA